jgi:parvulin-like peptidyl-prolyl isomerase
MRYILISSLFLCASLPAQQAPQLSPDTVVMRIGSRAVTRAEFERLALGMRVNVANDSPDARRGVGERIGATLAAAEEARRRKKDQDPAVDGRLRWLQEQLLASTLMDSVLADVRKDESAVRKYFETHPSPGEYRKLRHILVRFDHPGDASKPTTGRSEAAALERTRALRSKILSGADFAAVARAESDDEKTASQGGDLGVQNPGAFQAEFSLAAFQLPAGAVSEPVKSADGYHLILVEKVVPPKFEEVRRSVEYQMALERIQAMTKAFELNEEYFGKR